eukprot:gb/GFBE01016167.1/.p1 GENE.gb/GFBE01016167.1/~~gb/GFBE01016167.1/.p1  ORF type:complete len:516 (+),score=111.33 gb/GFBE01016167.1/:1-1548(+)
MATCRRGWLLCLVLSSWRDALALSADRSCETARQLGSTRFDVEGTMLVQLSGTQRKGHLQGGPEESNLTASANEPAAVDATNATGNKTNSSVGELEEHIAKEAKKDVKDGKIEKVVTSSKTRSKLNSTDTGSSDTVNASDDAPFASAAYKKNATDDFEVTVRIATPTDIISVYLLLYVPLLMAWSYYFYQAAGIHQAQLYLLLVQLSFGALTIGSVVTNQSLSVLMKAPMALTSIQAFSMFMLAGLGAIAQHFRRGDPEDSRPSAKEVADSVYRWTPASLGFLLFQLADHFVSYECSLSERTVFGNVAPVLGLTAEFCLSAVLAPRATDSSSASFSSRMALFLTIFGALLFGLQYPDFTWTGARVSSFFVAAHVVYRMLQRYLIDQVQAAPTLMLVCWDGFVLMVPSLILSIGEIPDFWQSWSIWLANPSIVVMLVLSMLTFGMGHWVALLIMKASTATLTMVVANIASSACVVQGIVFFGDDDFQKPLVIVGILVSIAGGFWYSAIQALNNKTE